jgi:hypothetical protein
MLSLAEDSAGWFGALFPFLRLYWPPLKEFPDVDVIR